MNNLGTKLFSLICLFICCFFSFLFYRSYHTSNQHTLYLLKQQADLALKFEMATRKYIGEEVRPVMYELIGQDRFVPEVMSSSFVARSIFAEVKKDFPDFILKFSSDNPRNQLNEAGPEELEIIDYFNRNPDIDTWEGEISINGQPYMAKFNARRMKDSCLHCHGEPKDAPASLIQRYGDQAGFHRPVGKVIALDTIAVPMARIDQLIWQDFKQNLWGFALGLIVLLISIYLTVSGLISKRLAVITSHFSKNAHQSDTLVIAPLQVDGKDEISLLARSFNKLAERLRTMYLALQDEISVRKKTNEKLLLEVGIRRKVQDDNLKLEGQLQQAQKMEAIGTLAGGIAHDFNNILSAILGYTEIARHSLPEEHADIKGYMAEVTTASRRAQELVKQILSFSRRSDGDSIFPVQVQTLLKECVKLLRATIPANITIEQNILNDCPPIYANPTHIHQLILNICTNSFHAMEAKGGTLRVELKSLKVEQGGRDNSLQLAPGQYVKMTFSDTGHGMTAEVRGKIFEPYFTTKKAGAGTGLGLAVVQSIIKMYDGVITVSGEEGVGTVFEIYFPVFSADKIKRPDTLAAVPKGTERILLVDDEEPIVNVARQTLSELGYEVTGVTSSPEALQLLEAEKDGYDLLITDQTMPQMSGSELIEQVLRLRPDLPIILCTGYSSVFSEEDAMALGVKEYVMKPVVGQDLAHIIRRVLDSQ